MRKQNLSNKIRENICEIMYDMVYHGEFEGYPEESMKFEECSDESLIDYRDNYIVHVMEFDNKDYLDDLQAYLYDENVYEYWNIEK